LVHLSYLDLSFPEKIKKMLDQGNDDFLRQNGQKKALKLTLIWLKISSYFLKFSISNVLVSFSRPR
jgi:hypothetical protein